MSKLHLAWFLLLLLLGGCHTVDFHPNRPGAQEALSEPEIRAVIDKFKLRMARVGLLNLVQTEQYNGHYVRFSTSAMQPNATYLVLAYAPEEGFILNFPYTTYRSVIDERVTDIRLQTEEVIFEVTSKKVPLTIYVELP